MKFFDYTKLSFSALVKKIGSSRYFDLPAMLEEVLNRLSGRVETLENAPSGGIESLSGDFVDNTDPTNPTLDRGYKVYTALLTQSGTDAPTAIVLENTLGGVPVWSRYTTGVAQAELIGAFTLEKTVVIPFAHVSSGASGDTMKIYDDEGYSTDNVRIEQKNFAGGSIDDYTGVGVEIRVYN